MGHLSLESFVICFIFLAGLWPSWEFRYEVSMFSFGGDLHMSSTKQTHSVKKFVTRLGGCHQIPTFRILDSFGKDVGMTFFDKRLAEEAAERLSEPKFDE